MSGDPAREGKPWRAAVVVFVEVADAGDQRDADVIAQLAVRQAITSDRIPVLPADMPVVSLRGQETVQIVEVMDVGMAAGNGYLWTRPTAKAFWEQGGS